MKLKPRTKREPSFDDQFLEVDVEAYDANHKSKLLKYTCATDISRVIGNKIKIPKADFITYLAFHHRRDQPDLNTRAALAERGKLLLRLFNPQLSFSMDSIQTKATGNDALPGLAESIGQATGLCVIDKIHGLVVADWTRILIGQHKDLDYEIAASSSSLIELETKGSAVPDNRYQSKISGHRASIEEKKAEKERRQPAGTTSIRYGTIGVIDSRPGSSLKCWLLDPEPQSDGDNPRRLKVLHRLSYIADLLLPIAPRSPITVALFNRIQAVAHSSSWESLSGLPLLGWKGEQIDLPVSKAYPDHLAWFDARPAVSNMNVGGCLVPLTDSTFLFSGIDASLLKLAVSQDFGELTRFGVKPEFTRGATILSKHKRRQFSGPLFRTSAGRVFGLVRHHV